MKAGADCVDGDYVAARVCAVEINRADNQQLSAFELRVLLGRDDCAHDSRDDHARACRLTGIDSSTLPCGRGITCTLTSSPTRRAAAAPASVAALTAATSPRTIAVTNPAPIFS